MGRKSVLESYLVVDGGDLAGNVTSLITNVKNLDRYFYEVEWSGASVDGSLSVEVRSDSNANWETLPIGAIPVSTDTGSHKISITEIAWQETRVVYTRVDGTGSISVRLNAAVGGA